MKPRVRLAIVVLLLAAAHGCSRRQGPPADSGPPIVNVSRPIQRNVVDSIDYTGRSDAVNSVDIRPRVTGYLTKMPFTEGSDVKKGELLFEVDTRPYQAQLDQATGQLELAKARLKVAQANNSLAKETGKTPGAISVQDVNKYQAAEEEALADVDAAKANVEVNRLNREFCEVTSPIDGQVSRYYFTPRQPRESGSDAADDRRIARSALRLFRSRRTHDAAHPHGDQRRQAAPRTAGRDSGADGRAG